MKSAKFAALPLTLAIALAACGQPDNDIAELETATTDGEAAALAKALEPGDFANLQLGAKIIGPRGPEVKSSLTNEYGTLADITSYVACPAGMTECDPKTAPEGTVYTYVHIVYPGEDMDPTTGAGDGTDDVHVESAGAFMMAAPAHGFTGNAGFSKAEAVVAAGDDVDVIMTCEEGGALFWTVNAGDGGNQWEDAEPLTFYWQSTLPPAGPATAYSIRANDVTGTGEGPFPAANPEHTNACTSLSTTR